MDKDINKKVIKILAEHLGVEPEDIDENDTFEHELHMRASDLSDFLGSLENTDFDTGNIDLTQIETVGDLIDALGGETFSDDGQS